MIYVLYSRKFCETQILAKYANEHQFEISAHKHLYTVYIQAQSKWTLPWCYHHQKPPFILLPSLIPGVILAWLEMRWSRSATVCIKCGHTLRTPLAWPTAAWDPVLLRAMEVALMLWPPVLVSQTWIRTKWMSESEEYREGKKRKREGKVQEGMRESGWELVIQLHVYIYYLMLAQSTLSDVVWSLIPPTYP